MNGREISGVLAIDPGTEQSGVVMLSTITHQVLWSTTCENQSVLDLMGDYAARAPEIVCAIEMVESYGKPVGRETFQTVLWIGRFVQQWAPRRCDLISRREIKRVLCDTERHVTDAVIRQRLLDLYGPGRDKAVGRKATPGPLYGIKDHAWAALAVGIAWLELNGFSFPPPLTQE